MKPDENIKSKEINSFIEWFESHYTPGEKGRTDHPRVAELVIKGLKGNIVISMMYEQDLISLNKKP